MGNTFAKLLERLIEDDIVRMVKSLYVNGYDPQYFWFEPNVGPCVIGYKQVTQYQYDVPIVLVQCGYPCADDPKAIEFELPSGEDGQICRYKLHVIYRDIDCEHYSNAAKQNVCSTIGFCELGLIHVYFKTPPPCISTFGDDDVVPEDEEGAAEHVLGCAICHSGIRPNKERALPCSHCFHAKCIDTWKTVCRDSDQMSTCPMCRRCI